MRHLAESALLAVVGSIVAAVAVNGSYLNFVKPAMHLPLIVSGVLLLLAAAYGLILEHPSQGHTPRVAGLLLVPFVVLALLRPGPLGAYSAQRAAAPPVVTAPSGLPALPPGDAPVTMPINEFTGRALLDGNRSLQGRQVRLLGFVTPRGTTWDLSRMVIMCCAADAYAARVHLAAAPPAPPKGAWVTVTGTLVPPTKAELAKAAKGEEAYPTLRVQSVDPATKPSNPYE